MQGIKGIKQTFMINQTFFNFTKCQCPDTMLLTWQVYRDHRYIAYAKR